jgi:hypothetical protein
MPLRTDDHHAIGQATALAYGHIIQTTTNERGRMYRCTGHEEHRPGSCRYQYESAHAIPKGTTTTFGPITYTSTYSTYFTTLQTRDDAASAGSRRDAPDIHHKYNYHLSVNDSSHRTLTTISRSTAYPSRGIGARPIISKRLGRLTTHRSLQHVSVMLRARRRTRVAAESG